MDLAKIQQMLKLVAESDVAEIEVEEEGYKLVIRKHSPSIVLQPPPGYYPPVHNPGYPQQPLPSQPQQAVGPDAGQPAAPVSQPEAPVAAVAPAIETNLETVHAPIVGTFYRASSPESQAFVEVGSKVALGDVLCIIEAMKIMNEIECEVPGTIRRILVDDTAPVEYEQALFEIEPLT